MNINIKVSSKCRVSWNSCGNVLTGPGGHRNDTYRRTRPEEHGRSNEIQLGQEKLSDLGRVLDRRQNSTHLPIRRRNCGPVTKLSWKFTHNLHLWGESARLGQSHWIKPTYIQVSLSDGKISDPVSIESKRRLHMSLSSATKSRDCWSTWVRFQLSCDGCPEPLK